MDPKIYAFKKTDDTSARGLSAGRRDREIDEQNVTCQQTYGFDHVRHATAVEGDTMIFYLTILILGAQYDYVQ